MPYIIQKEEDNYCVYTQGEDKKPTGKAHGCHPTEEAAKAQMRALYANVEDAKKEAKSKLVADDGQPWKVGDVAMCGFPYPMDNTPPSGPCMVIIRQLADRTAVCECLDMDFKPTGKLCTCSLDNCTKYNLDMGTDLSGKSVRIEIISDSIANGDQVIEYKSIAGFKPESINGRTVDGIAAVTGNMDDASDITHKGAFLKTIQERRKRIMFTFNHELEETPRARIDELKEIPRSDLPVQIKSQFPEATGGLFVRRTYLETPRGEEAFQGVITGAIPEMSYGYQAIKKDRGTYEGKSVRNLYEVRLIDICDTTLGVNPATLSRKSALPYHETPKASEDTTWDAGKEVDKADVSDLKEMCAWVDSENSENKTAYKLPHHLASGEHAVVWDGVRAAMAALMGSRGGVDIPVADKKAVYNHLAKHYAQFDKEPPDYKMLEIASSVSQARNLLAQGVDFKAGRMISAANEAKIRGAIEAIEQQLETLEDLLGAAEPPAEEESEGKALTDPKYLLALLDLKLADIEWEGDL